MKASRLAAVAAALVLGGTLGGCGVSVTPAGPASSSPPAATPPAGTPTSAGEPVPSVSVGTPTVPPVPTVPTVPSVGSTASGPAPSSSADPKDLPADFPLPDGATLDSVVHDGDHEIAATLTVTDGSRAFAFWRDGLGDHGYRVVRAEGGFGAYEIRFSGHGCGGNSQIALTGSRAAVECDLS